MIPYFRDSPNKKYPATTPTGYAVLDARNGKVYARVETVEQAQDYWHKLTKIDPDAAKHVVVDILY